MKFKASFDTEFPGYLFLSTGEVFSFKSNKLLAKCIDSVGYYYVGLTNKSGKRVSMTIHRAMAKAFLGPRPHKAVVDHIDGNGLNNNIKNLRYITHQHNLIRSKKTYKNNRAGSTGVCFMSKSKRWRAYLTVDRKKVLIRLFKTKEQAILARQKAEEIYHRDFD